MTAEDVQIRLAVIDDVGSIGEILFEAFSVNRSDYTPEAFAAVTPPANEIVLRFDQGPNWVATIKDRIVGTVSAVPEPDYLYIRSLAVRPVAQGLGIGYRLLDAVEKYGVETGFGRLFLYTTYFSPGAIELYEKFGFRRGRDTSAKEWFGTPGLEMDKLIGKYTKHNVVGS